MNRTQRYAVTPPLTLLITLLSAPLAQLDAAETVAIPDAWRGSAGQGKVSTTAGIIAVERDSTAAKEFATARELLFWQLDLYRGLQRHYPKPRPYATEAVRWQNWKLLAKDGEPLELFDLDADLRETNNLLDTQPEIAARLARSVRSFLDAPRDSSGIAEKHPAKK